MVATFRSDDNFGRILAAYGGISVAGSIARGMIADGCRPDRYDVTLAWHGCRVRVPVWQAGTVGETGKGKAQVGDGDQARARRTYGGPETLTPVTGDPTPARRRSAGGRRAANTT
ncbi:hypothetical protein GCM10010518_58710 [Kitasatospora cinereorecta]